MFLSLVQFAVSLMVRLQLWVRGSKQRRQNIILRTSDQQHAVKMALHWLDLVFVCQVSSLVGLTPPPFPYCSLWKEENTTFTEDKRRCIHSSRGRTYINYLQKDKH